MFGCTHEQIGNFLPKVRSHKIQDTLPRSLRPQRTDFLPVDFRITKLAELLQTCVQQSLSALLALATRADVTARILQQQYQLPIICRRGFKTEATIKRVGCTVDGMGQQRPDSRLI